MGSGIIYYEYGKREKFEDYDLRADAELGTFKIRRYHFDDESFVHPLHSVRFDPDRPWSGPMPHYSPRMSSSTRRVVSPSPTVVSSSLHHRVAGKMLRPPRSWELSSPSEGWMCKGDEEEKEIGGMKPSVEKEEASEKEEEEEDPKEDQEEEEEEEEEEEDPEEEVPASTSLPIDACAS
ncbi:hypothetical protein PIB30_077054 [Stylosanthes scabra]|uniref:Uncharacterized protein n=1 Tax=Stylosanthes scabra TaxID=79078 RepID=A0ABU6XQ37_9FABA|nr:hypothetical protein [Stylosanthes scabra]